MGKRQCLCKSCKIEFPFATRTVKGEGQSRRSKYLKGLRENPHKRLAASLREALDRVWHNRIDNAPILWSNTEFVSAQDAINHLATKKPDNMSLEEARKTLEVKHGIPIRAYDHRIPEKVRKCHSKANLGLMTRMENEEKATKVIPSVCHAVGREYWPVGGGGVLPSQH